MTTQPDLFDPPPARYPEAPGFARGSDTSEAAAPSREEAGRLRLRVLMDLRAAGPSTPDEIAERLHLSPLAVRPRVTELRRKGLVFDTGLRRTNRQTGKTAAVMAAR